MGCGARGRFGIFVPLAQEKKRTEEELTSLRITTGAYLGAMACIFPRYICSMSSAYSSSRAGMAAGETGRNRPWL